MYLFHPLGCLIVKRLKNSKTMIFLYICIFYYSW
nr:MAG TPA: hypothetical protein [Bacteriophage sp.]